MSHTVRDDAAPAAPAEAAPATRADVAPAAAAGRRTRVVLMTAPSAEAAEHVVRSLVEERLAACGNIVAGVTSIYRWEGALQRDAEVLVILKTRAASVDAMIRRAAELHPYEVPELLAVDVVQGFEPYMEWVERSSG